MTELLRRLRLVPNFPLGPSSLAHGLQGSTTRRSATGEACDGVSRSLTVLMVLLVALGTTAVAQVDPSAEAARLASKSIRARLKAVEKSSDQAFLAEVAKVDPDMDVQKAALAKVGESGLLTSIATTRFPNDEDTWRSWDIRIEATKKVTDQAALARIATDASSEYVQAAAIERITDADLLARFLASEQPDNVRLAALTNLGDPVILADVAQKDPKPLVRSAAVKKLFDQTTLASIAGSDENEGVRMAAIAGLSDRSIADELLRTVAERPPVFNLRWGMTSSEISDAMGGAVTFRDAATIELTDPALVGEEESTRVQFAMKSGLLKAVAVFHHLPDMGTFSALTSTLTYGVHVTDLTEKFGEPESRIDEEGNKVTRWNRGPLGGAVVLLVDGGDGSQALSIVYTAPDVTP